MIIEIRADNCYVFQEPIVLSLKADMRNRKFAANVHAENHFHVLKTVGIYGQNNAGKTCLIKCILNIRRVFLNKKLSLKSNMFSGSPICGLGMTFLYQGREFSYDLKYDTSDEKFVFEKFVEITKDQHGNEKEIVWLLIDDAQKHYQCADQEAVQMISMVARKSIFCHVIDADQFRYLEEMKKIITGFADQVDVINMNNIPIKKTIELMKNKDRQQQRIVEFIRNADLYMDNFEYVDMSQIHIEGKEEDQRPEEKALDIPERFMDQLRLVSTYKGVSVPSMLFDSTGTKKIAALASYIIEGLDKGRMLIVDELDSSIHFKLTRAIVAMFNNELNKAAQLIFTVHDINLMDCKRMFRKEQIWFVHKDTEGVYVYSLASFTAQKGVRDTTDIMEKYRRGALGALPDPELIKSLLDLKGNKRGEATDEE